MELPAENDWRLWVCNARAVLTLGKVVVVVAVSGRKWPNQGGRVQGMERILAAVWHTGSYPYFLPASSPWTYTIAGMGLRRPTGDQTA